MSVTGSTNPAPKYPALQIPGELVSLDTLFKESMKKVHSGFDCVRIIVRCDTLPLVAGESEPIRELFGHLIRMIIGSSPPGYQIYLLVDCIEMESSTDTLYKRYQVRFHTNITTNDEWKKKHEASIQQCDFILARHDGNLLVNNITNTGCLFSLTLPGKLQSDAIP